jgi:hypothetical protein
MKKTLKKFVGSALAFGAVLGMSVGAHATNITANITTDTTWTTAGNPYILENIIYVTNGADLTIEPGVVIRGVPDSFDGNTSNNNPGTLVITRGSKIFANGTAANPIVFTDLNDDAVSGSTGTAPYNGVNNVSGTCGGVILLGKTHVTSTNDSDPSAAGSPVATDGNQIEGLTTLNFGRYGGNLVNVPISGDPQTLADDNDDSGSMSYWSIRYGGEVIGTSNEINGFTLGAVGRQTDIHHIEVVNALDDGVEFFGGTVNTKYMVVFHSGDDSIDWDEGFRGKGQYWLVMQGAMTGTVGSGKSDRAGEMDGANNGDNNVPFSAPTFYNVTMIGLGGPNEVGAPSADRNMLHLTDGSGGRFFNTLILANNNGVVAIEDTAVARDSRDHNSTLYSTAAANGLWVDAQNGNAPMYDHDDEGARILDFDQVEVWDVNGVLITSGLAGISGYAPSFNGTITDLGDAAGARPIQALTMAISNSVYETVTVDPRAANSATSTTRTAPADGFFDQAGFKGAVGPNYNWLQGWAHIDNVGVITSPDNAAPTSATPEFLFSVTFNTVSGTSYLVQASSSPAGPFTSIGSVVGTGSATTVVDSRSLSTRQFYQVVQQ